MSKEILDFANTLTTTAEKLRLSVVKRRGQKILGRCTRVALSGIKNAIPNIKRKIMENENE